MLFALLLGCPPAPRAATGGSQALVAFPPPDACSAAWPEASGGGRTLALIVGVSEYTAPEVPDLAGPVNDALAMRQALEKLGVPRGDMCFLSSPTAAEFRAAWGRLAAGVSGRDRVIVYFAGHGSQVPDGKGEEPDQRDETWVFADGRGPDPAVGELVDDELAALWRQATDTGARLTILVDACHSGTSTRGAVARQLAPLPAMTRDEPIGSDTNAELVVLAAATDASLALEAGGRGYFTQALVDALASDTRRSWREVYAATSAGVAQRSGGRQVPFAEGHLEWLAFGSGDESATGWSITSWEDGRIHLQGVPTEGWGVGATVRVKHPRCGDVLATVDTYDHVDAWARVEGAPECEKDWPGLAAALVVAAPSEAMLTIRSDPGLSEETARALETVTRQLGGRVRFEPGACSPGHWCLTEAAQTLKLVGPEGRVRNQIASDAGRIQGLTEMLTGHVRQAVLLGMARDGGDRSVAIDVYTERPPSTPSSAGWSWGCPNETQMIPRCDAWVVKATNRVGGKELFLGGAVLWGNGAITALPLAPIAQRAAAFETALLDPGLAFEAGPPIDPAVPQSIVIVGTAAPLDWRVLSDGGALLDLDALAGRGTAEGWAAQRVDLRVSANPGWEDAPACVQPGSVDGRVSSFDTRVDLSPYTPASPEDPLARLLGALATSRTVDEAFAAAKLDGALSTCTDTPRLGDRVGGALVIDPALQLVWKDGAFAKAPLTGACQRHPGLAASTPDPTWYLEPCR